MCMSLYEIQECIEKDGGPLRSLSYLLQSNILLLSVNSVLFLYKINLHHLNRTTDTSTAQFS